MTTKFTLVLCFILCILVLELSGCSVVVSNTTPQPASQLSRPSPVDSAIPTVLASGYPDGLLTETFSPVLGATNVPTRPFFQWPSIQGAVSYDFQLADNPFYANPIDSQTGLTITLWEEPKTLEQSETYYWRVRGPFSGWVDDWITSSFTTAQVDRSVPMETLTPIPNSVMHGDLLPGGGGASDLVIDSGATNVTIKPVFEWPAMKGALSYDFQLADNPVFNNPLDDLKGLRTTTWSELHTLEYDHSYYWRYRAEYLDGTVSDWVRGLLYAISAPISTPTSG